MTNEPTLSGPMFAPAESELRRSVHKKQGAHYNIYAGKRGKGMELLRNCFPEGEANELNLAVFSTSGVHGLYTTIEEIEASQAKYGFLDEMGEEDLRAKSPDGELPEDYCDELTYTIYHPRTVTLTYGVMRPAPEDIPYLKKLRQTSWDAFSSIGKAEEPPSHGGHP